MLLSGLPLPPPLPSLPSFLFCCTQFVWSLAFLMQKLPPVPAGFAKDTPQAAPPGAMPDQRMEPWVSSLCATLSQKGGLEVISALLSLRAPWQHSHLDINTHQNRAHAQTQSRGLQRPGGRCRQGARTSGGPQDAKECQPRRFKVNYGPHQIQLPDNSGTHLKR